RSYRVQRELELLPDRERDRLARETVVGRDRGAVGREHSTVEREGRAAPADAGKASWREAGRSYRHAASLGEAIARRTHRRRGGARDLRGAELGEDAAAAVVT